MPRVVNPVRIGRIAGAMALVTVMVSACGSSDSSSSDGSSTSPSAAASSAAYATAQVQKYEAVPSLLTVNSLSELPDLEGKTVWYIPISNAFAVNQIEGEYLKTVLGKLGATVEVCDGKLKSSTIAECMTQAVAEKAAAVITAYIDYSMVPTGFENLTAHQIPVVVGGETPTGGASNGEYLAFLSFDKQNFLANRIEADNVIADSGGDANVLALRIMDSTATTKASDEANAEFKERCSACAVTTLEVQTADASKVSSAVSAALVAHPDIDYVATYDGQLQNVNAAISSVGRTDSIKISAWGGTVAGLQAVQDSAQNIGNVGSAAAVFNAPMAVDTLLRLMTGQEFNSEPDAVMMRAFTKSNISDLDITDEAYATGEWYGYTADEIFNVFYDAWGVN